MNHPFFRSIALAAILSLASCTTTVAPDRSVDLALPPLGVPQKVLDRVLGEFVDDKGLVDYTGLAADSAALEQFYAASAAVSPDREAERFPSREFRLAYWINAYNAAVLKMVLRHYPIESVTDVREPWYLGFLPERSGFFYLHRPIFGGEKISLYDVENDIVRPRFTDPRIHFALNCGSIGCPRLPRRAFTPENLDEELDRETRLFLSESRNLTIDHAAGQVRLSSIFDWYITDFVESGEPKDLLDWIQPYLAVEPAAELEKARDYAIVFEPYDWRLNDQASAGT